MKRCVSVRIPYVLGDDLVGDIGEVKVDEIVEERHG